MAEKHESPQEQIYQERINWATKKAKELGIGYNHQEDPDHFRIGNTLLPTWKTIPLRNAKDSSSKTEELGIEEAAEATKMFPNEDLYSVVQKLREQKKSSK